MISICKVCGANDSVVMRKHRNMMTDRDSEETEVMVDFTLVAFDV